MFLTGATEAGQPGGVSEDWVCTTSDLIVVLDGATARTDTGCRHGVAWYTRELGAGIIAAAADHSRSLRQVLADAIQGVAALHPECDLQHPGTPSAAAAVVRLDADTLRYMVLGDVTVAVEENNTQVTVVSDERVSQTAAAQRQLADRYPIGAPGKAAALLEMKHAELAARNQPGGYWIAATDPSVVEHAIVGEIPLSKVTRVAVATDGAARLVTMFEKHTWATVLDLLENRGPAEMIRRVRDAEADDPAGRMYPRNKVSDDATIAFAIPEPVRKQHHYSLVSDIAAIAASGRLFGACPTGDGRIL